MPTITNNDADVCFEAYASFTPRAVAILGTKSSTNAVLPNLTVDYPLVPATATETVPKGVEIYQYDNSTLGCRHPLVFVHGLLGEYHPPCFRWQQLAQHLSQAEEFQRTYKIYMARYDTRSSRKDLISDFARVLRRFDGQPTTIVTISISGAIIYDAMRKSALNQSIEKVITLGAFFPIFLTP